nr:TNT domain-containing protein [Kibdelosporangium sp. MJ126-NF4]
MVVAALIALMASLLGALSGSATADVSRAGVHAAAACEGAFQGDARLGPATLPGPSDKLVGPLLVGYQRTGGLSSKDFLDRYWDPAANDNQGAWRYPPQDGFLLDPQGQPIKWVRTLPVGTELDRFGSEFGGFLSPAGTSYAARSIPPQSLYTFEAAYPCNYHKYRVITAFAVSEGPIAPWFEQHGVGVQDKLERSLVPGEGRLTVNWLLANNYLARVG